MVADPSLLEPQLQKNHRWGMAQRCELSMRACTNYCTAAAHHPRFGRVNTNYDPANEAVGYVLSKLNIIEYRVGGVDLG